MNDHLQENFSLNLLSFLSVLNTLHTHTHRYVRNDNNRFELNYRQGKERSSIKTQNKKMKKTM